MNARAKIAALLWWSVPGSTDQESRARAGEMLDAFAAEVRAETPTTPSPAGDQPQPCDDQRLAEIQSLDLLAMMPDKSAAIVSGHLAALLAEVQRLKAERHSTNEALSDAAEALRDMRDRLTKHEGAAR